MNTNFQRILDEIYEETLPLLGQGKVASYIPALVEVNPAQYGIAIQTLSGEAYQGGGRQYAFFNSEYFKGLYVDDGVRQGG